MRSSALGASGPDFVSDDEGAERSQLLATRTGGRVVTVGIPDDDRTTFSASLVRRKELTLAASRRMLPSDLSRAGQLAGSGVVRSTG